MARTMVEVKYSNFEEIQNKIYNLLQMNGYKNISENNENVWKCGVGFLTAIKYIKIEFAQNNTLIIYCTEEEGYDSFTAMGRVFRIYKEKYKQDLRKISDALNERLSKHKEYLFSYNGLSVKLKYQDIIYIEKDEKNLVYHTKKGLFYERCSIAQKAEEMEAYDIIRINSGILVNYEYIFRIMQDEVELLDHTKLPISRARRNYVSDFVRSKAQR